MSETSDIREPLALTEAAPVVERLCPLLALQSDPGSRAAYLRLDHICLNRDDNPLSIQWQGRYCLSGFHKACPYFTEQPKHAPEDLAGEQRNVRRVEFRRGLIVATALGLLLLLGAGLVFVRLDRGPEADADRLLLPTSEARGPGGTDLPTAPASAASTPPDAAGASVNPSPTAEPLPSPTPAPTVTPTPAPTSTVQPTPVFAATHRSTDLGPVNFRAEPSTSSNIVQMLAPGTPLQFLNTQQEAEGATWLQFRIETGASGWIRAIDALPVSG